MRDKKHEELDAKKPRQLPHLYRFNFTPAHHPHCTILIYSPSLLLHRNKMRFTNTTGNRESAYSKLPQKYFLLFYNPSAGYYRWKNPTYTPQQSSKSSWPIDHYDSLDTLLFGKAYFLNNKINWLEKQIDNRNSLFMQNLDRIDSDIIYFDTKLMQHYKKWGWHFNLLADKNKAVLEKEVASLEKEKRAEEVACWKDTVALKESLIDILREYESAKNRANMLNENGN